jgi:3-hydroxyisobutyrate dehydrogenase-like beta-hydroxyacid dehydrogenase
VDLPFEPVAMFVSRLPSSSVLCPSSDALAVTAKELSKVARPPKVLIETSTLPIEVKQRARRRLQTRGVVLLDCPISGTGAQARTRDIVVYASGERAAYRRVAPVLDVFARAHEYQTDDDVGDVAEGHDHHRGVRASARVQDAAFLIDGADL